MSRHVVRAKTVCPKGHAIEAWKGHRAFGRPSRVYCEKCGEIRHVRWEKIYDSRDAAREEVQK